MSSDFYFKMTLFQQICEKNCAAGCVLVGGEGGGRRPVSVWWKQESALWHHIGKLSHAGTSVRIFAKAHTLLVLQLLFLQTDLSTQLHVTTTEIWQKRQKTSDVPCIIQMQPRNWKQFQNSISGAANWWKYFTESENSYSEINTLINHLACYFCYIYIKYHNFTKGHKFVIPTW